MSTSKGNFITRQTAKLPRNKRKELELLADQITAIDQLVKSGAKLGWMEEQPDEAHIVVYGSRSQARYWKHKGTKVVRALLIPIRKK
jgi:hypothetical protein